MFLLGLLGVVLSVCAVVLFAVLGFVFFQELRDQHLTRRDRMADAGPGLFDRLAFRSRPKHAAGTADASPPAPVGTDDATSDVDEVHVERVAQRAWVAGFDAKIADVNARFDEIMKGWGDEPVQWTALDFTGIDAVMDDLVDGMDPRDAVAEIRDWVTEEMARLPDDLRAMAIDVASGEWTVDELDALPNDIREMAPAHAGGQ